ncbi:MAG: ferrous iron transport protein A [Proteobacteria bacterium]|nr:ferrous iron transport protein A [Pseudomonadota bacterium]
MTPTPARPAHERIRLTGTPVGRLVHIAEFGDDIDPLQREQLHAYGLSTTHPVRVLQQQPMTVILCDHVEIALEHVVARNIWVEAG